MNRVFQTIIIAVFISSPAFAQNYDCTVEMNKGQDEWGVHIDLKKNTAELWSIHETFGTNPFAILNLTDDESEGPGVQIFKGQNRVQGDNYSLSFSEKTQSGLETKGSRHDFAAVNCRRAK